ncbi:19720_t:CDS:1, partial [Racocetra persica]
LGSCRQNELGFEKKKQKRYRMYKDCTKEDKKVLPCRRPIAALMDCTDKTRDHEFSNRNSIDIKTKK